MSTVRPAVSASAPGSSSTSASSSSAAASATPGVLEYTVRMSKDKQKKYSIMKFNVESKVEFTTMAPVVLQRENNLKDFKSAYHLEAMPKFGAGSEFGRELKDEARRKKFGITLRKYNPDDQPWLMKAGPGKAAKRYRGIREGGVAENASYFLFMQSPDGAFEASPVDNWYQFTPVINYKCLNAEEAEEEYSRRDKTLNMFSIMMRRRLKAEDGNLEDEDGAAAAEDGDNKGKLKQGKKKGRGLMLTEMEDWAEMSDEDEDKDESGEEGDKEKKNKGAKGKGKSSQKKKVKKEKVDSDEEAVEDSDDGDEDDREVDYMSDTSESDSDVEGRVKKIKYEEKGVEDEDGLRDLVASDNEEEEEEDKEDKAKSGDANAGGAAGGSGENEEEKGSSKGGHGPVSTNGSSSSSSSESDSDDPDQADNEFTKAFLMMGGKKSEKAAARAAAAASGGSGSRPSTPATDSSKKRRADGSGGKGDAADSSSPLAKKVKTEDASSTSTLLTSAAARPNTPTTGGASAKPSTPSSASKADGVSEEALRRYLMRKPMTTKDLLQKFRSKKTGLSNEELVQFVVGTLKKLKPEQQKINNTIYWTIKNA